MNKIVYLIVANNQNYKIGITTQRNLNRRIKTLQTGNSDKLEVVKTYPTNYASLIERTLHREFSTKKINGEWFNLSVSDVLTFEDKCRNIENNINILKNQDNDYILKMLKI